MTIPPPARRPAALVTGGSSGIGMALARCLARDGHELVIVARREPALAAAAAELRALGARGVTTIPADLSRREEIQRLLATLHASGLDITILVNNAGFGMSGPFAECRLDDALELIDTNVSALTHLTRALLPAMCRLGQGRILNVASTAAFQPGPFMAVYYASKAYVLSFSEAIAEELRGTGVTVTTLCPGPTATGFAERAAVGETRLFRRGVVLSAAQVAEAGYRAMLHGEGLVVPGAGNRLMTRAGRLAPRALVTRVMRRLNEHRSPPKEPPAGG
ncbi:MAG TPA: SDR family oxidoreductase [Gemmatimonadales bacterium]|nr:SDR family oxidoreductase [Gemmatimonadales bacterium]